MALNGKEENGKEEKKCQKKAKERKKLKQETNGIKVKEKESKYFEGRGRESILK